MTAGAPEATRNRLTKLTFGVTTTYTYDAANQLTVENADGTLTTYSYDANGSLTTQNAGGSVTTYTWDGENRMRSVTLPTGAVTTFTYDADGLRRRTEVAGATKLFVWDHQDVLLETDGSGTTQAAYTQGVAGYGPLVAQRRAGTSSFYHFDALGSTTELTDASGNGTDSTRYYAFGETKGHSGTTTNPFGFVGRLGYYSEGDLGLQYLRARWYQPRVGRFLSADPIGAESRYGYVGNRPCGPADPSGLQPCPGSPLAGSPFEPGREKGPQVLPPGLDYPGRHVPPGFAPPPPQMAPPRPIPKTGCEKWASGEHAYCGDCCDELAGKAMADLAKSTEPNPLKRYAKVWKIRLEHMLCVLACMYDQDTDPHDFFQSN